MPSAERNLEPCSWGTALAEGPTPRKDSSLGQALCWTLGGGKDQDQQAEPPSKGWAVDAGVGGPHCAEERLMFWEHLAALVSQKNKGSRRAWTFTKTTFMNTGPQGSEVREGPSPSPTHLAWQLLAEEQREGLP